MKKIKVVHYINQFFAGIGGEEKADIEPELRKGAIGPGMALQSALGDDAEIASTIICGDSYFGENIEKASETILEMVKSENPDLFIAGPAFNAGRYGLACGMVSKIVKENLSIPVITGMYVENPGADMYRKDLYIVSTKNSAVGMRDAVKSIANLGLKIVKNEEILSPSEDGYIPRDIRVNYFADERGSKRAVKMLVKKLAGESFETEYPMPEFDRVDPNPAVKDMSKATIALVTSGGVVPKGNPDHIESSSASKYGRYSIAGIDALTEASHETAHGGYDPTYCNQNPNRVLPVDVLREMEKSGKIGKIYDYFFTTVGNGTSVASSKSYAEEYAKELVENKVDAVILTSTWGTCTRCGATMVKEIERAGIPVVHICTVVPISLTVGANRIVPAVAIPYPLGDISLPSQEEKELRKSIVEKALKALSTEVSEQTVFEN